MLLNDLRTKCCNGSYQAVTGGEGTSFYRCDTCLQPCDLIADAGKKVTDVTTRNKKILDVCCGGRMFWFDKHHPDTLYLDKRTLAKHLVGKGKNARVFGVEPDMVMDFRNLNIADNTFSLVVFDPPHIVRHGKSSYMAEKYGYLDDVNWREDLRAGFSECFRVLKNDGVLVFKWNECHIPLRKIIPLAPAKPLFGNRGGRSYKTHWLVFMKTSLNNHA